MQRRPPGQLQAVNQTIVLVTSGDNPSPSFEKERKEHANATCFSLFLSFQHHQTISQCHIISSSPHQRLGQLLQTLRVTLQDLRGLPSHGNGASLPNHGASTGLSFNAETGKHGKQLSHRIHACYIYGNIYHQDTPVMLAYIYTHTWILYGYEPFIEFSQQRPNSLQHPQRKWFASAKASKDWRSCTDSCDPDVSEDGHWAI